MDNDQFIKDMLNANAEIINTSTEKIYREYVNLDKQNIALEKLYEILVKRTIGIKKNIEIKSKLQKLLNTSILPVKFITKNVICAVTEPCNKCDECIECDELIKQLDMEKRDITNVNQYNLEVALLESVLTQSTKNLAIESDAEINLASESDAEINFDSEYNEENNSGS